jgi:hypothetical protein
MWMRLGLRISFKGLAVRRFCRLIVIVFALPLLASGSLAPAFTNRDLCGDWRRTNVGWQPVEILRPEIQYPRPALHPGVVASLEVLLTMTAMLALSKENPSQRRKLASTTGHAS